MRRIPRSLRETLPRRVRARLWLTGHVDGAAIHLVELGHFDAAERLWRACGMWHA